MNATWKREERLGIMLEEGQVIGSLKSIADEVGITVKQLRGANERLTDDCFMGKRSTNEHTILTLCNYEGYRGRKSSEGKQRASEEIEKGKQRATNKINKEIYTKRSSKDDPKAKEDFQADFPKQQVSKEKSSAKKETLRQRLHRFGKDLVPFVETYGKEMIRNFYDYWSEPDQSQTKMRCEMQKTWSLKSRLRLWKKREDEYRNEKHTRTAELDVKAINSNQSYREHHQQRIVANLLTETQTGEATDNVRPSAASDFDFDF